VFEGKGNPSWEKVGSACLPRFLTFGGGHHRQPYGGLPPLSTHRGEGLFEALSAGEREVRVGGLGPELNARAVGNLNARAVGFSGRSSGRFV
jgi:hypothetical protein